MVYFRNLQICQKSLRELYNPRIKNFQPISSFYILFEHTQNAKKIHPKNLPSLAESKILENAECGTELKKKKKTTSFGPRKIDDDKKCFEQGQLRQASWISSRNKNEM